MNMTFAITPDRKSKRISLTPLIDVVFILLLFFMLTSSFQRWHSVDFPNNTKPSDSSLSSSKEPVFLLLHTSGKLSLWPDGAVWASAGDINQTDFLTSHLGNSHPSVLLIPEHETRLQTILTASERLKELGLNVTLSEPVEKHDE